MVTGTATVTKMGKGFTAMVSKVQALTKKESHRRRRSVQAVTW